MIFKLGSLAPIVLLVMVAIGSADEIIVGGGTSVSVRDRALQEVF